MEVEDLLYFLSVASTSDRTAGCPVCETDHILIVCYYIHHFDCIDVLCARQITYLLCATVSTILTVLMSMYIALEPNLEWSDICYSIRVLLL
jgi:hypothetical protein